VSLARLVAGSGSESLAAAVAASGVGELVASELERFPDGELCPRVGELQGEDVYVICSTGPPVQEHLVELLLVLDACRRAGAAHLTAVVPYFGYARQDRGRRGQPIGMRVAAEAIATAGAERLVVVDPHGAGFEAACPVPCEILSARDLLVANLRRAELASDVVVAPDFGAAHLADSVADSLGLPVAFVRKHRVSGAVVEAAELVGDVRHRRVVVVDDMISTGATIEAAATLLERHGAAPGLLVAATHGVLVADAAFTLERAGVRHLVVTDSCVSSEDPPPTTTVCSIAPLLAEEIGRLHRGARW
jgi:ribose-phosphate pyrophosphokinase